MSNPGTSSKWAPCPGAVGELLCLPWNEAPGVVHGGDWALVRVSPQGCGRQLPSRQGQRRPGTRHGHCPNPGHLSLGTRGSGGETLQASTPPAATVPWPP